MSSASKRAPLGTAVLRLRNGVCAIGVPLPLVCGPPFQPTAMEETSRRGPVRLPPAAAAPSSAGIADDDESRGRCPQKLVFFTG